MNIIFRKNIFIQKIRYIYFFWIEYLNILDEFSIINIKKSGIDYYQCQNYRREMGDYKGMVK